METFQAIMLIEGGEPEQYEGHTIDAWQHLIDKGAASSFKGIIETTAAALVSLGYCRHNVHTWRD